MQRVYKDAPNIEDTFATNTTINPNRYKAIHDN